MSNINYAQYDFDEVVTQIRNILKTKDPVWDSFASSTITTMIELHAYIGEILMYYAERRAEESYIETAQLKSSIINLARLVNYQPRRKVSSTGVLQFSIAAAHTKNIFIPKYTEVQSSDGTKFVTIEETVIFAGSTTATASAVQGYLKTESLVSTGESNLEITLSYTDIDNTNLEVLVGNTKWTKVTSFVESVSTSAHYKVIQNTDDTISVIFGDGVFGKVPEENDTIEFNFIRSAGSEGNVYSTGVIVTLNSDITDIDGTAQTVTVTNTTSFLGGDDAEDKESIRYNAPRVFSTGDRAVTRGDYITLLENYPSVESANVWGEAEENPPNSTLFNKIRISMLLQNWTIPGTAFQQTISDYLLTKAQITVQYEFVDPTIVEVEATVTAKTTQDNSLATVQSSIESTLDSQFLLGIVTIGSAVRYSDIVKAIEDTSGVVYHTLLLKLKEQIGTGDDSETNFTGTLSLEKIKDSKVWVYSDDTLVGFANSANGGTSITDASTNSHTVTNHGSPVLDTRIKKFGNTSLNLNGSSYITISDHADFNLSSGIFSLDFHIQPDVLQSSVLYRQQTDSNNYFQVLMTSSGEIELKIVQGGSTIVSLMTITNMIDTDKMYHVRVVENGDNYYLFIDGKLDVTTSDPGRASNYTGDIFIGSNGTSSYFKGNIDEIRLSDSARSLAEFTPPTTEYADDSNTNLLLHMNGKGTFNAVGGSGLTGTIDYSTGEIDITYGSAPSSGTEINVKYEQDQEDMDLIPGKDEIVRLTEKNVTVTYVST